MICSEGKSTVVSTINMSVYTLYLRWIFQTDTKIDSPRAKALQFTSGSPSQLLKNQIHQIRFDYKSIKHATWSKSNSLLVLWLCRDASKYQWLAQQPPILETLPIPPHGLHFWNRGKSQHSASLGQESFLLGQCMGHPTERNNLKKWNCRNHWYRKCESEISKSTLPNSSTFFPHVNLPSIGRRLRTL